MTSTFRELEGASSALESVFLAFLHSAVAGQIAAVTEFLEHTDRAAIRGRLAFNGGRGSFGVGGAEHVLESAGHALADRAGLAGETAARCFDADIEPVPHLGQRQRPKDRVAILFF